MSSRLSDKKPSRSRWQSKENAFHQLLGRLTHYQAVTLLGDEGADLLRRGGQRFEIDTEQQVYLGGDLYRVRVADSALQPGYAIATVTLQSGRKKQLQANCDQCERACEHLGAALGHLLDAKGTLGLAQAPDASVPLEYLTEEELIRRALAEREQRANDEKMTARSIDPSQPWTDYIVTSHTSGRSYRVALRGLEPGESFCSCPDFRTNHLGTCKHILNVARKVQQKFPVAKRNKPYVRKMISVGVRYQAPLGLQFHLPPKLDDKAREIIGDADQRPIDGLEMMQRIQTLENAGIDFQIYPDAEEWIQSALVQQHLRQRCQEIRQDPAKHSLRRELLKAELLPYQLDGVAFAVGAGRAVLADDMGLGKTIQGIGVAELLAREAEIQRVLVVCPASLKSQWRSEINQFCDRSSQLIIGRGDERVAQYSSDFFFTICNYEQVIRDLTAIEAVPWDLIILDEGQRIKNWESKTSQVIRALESQFALVLSGTPMENRIDELYTVVQFVDEHRLGPAYRFFHRHRLVDERGKILGYQNLDELREVLEPILLRRRRSQVAKQLPDRTDEVVLIEPTAEQLEISTSQLQVASRIAAKKYWTEMDLLRLQKALLLARMSADSTFLIDKQEPEYSTKLERLVEILENLISSPDRKIVLFSEWRRMLDRIEKRLEAMDCEYVRLDGQVPQKKRPGIVKRFQDDPECRLILMTNAGSTGLNLQSANTVINVDLPWNPAVLEQRIARAHRMGQQNPVHVYKLVTKGTIEEKLLDTLDSKQQLADAAIDFDSDVTSVEMQSGIADLKKKLEKILPSKPDAPIDESQRRRVEQASQMIHQRRERVSAAGGQLLGAALQLVGELVTDEKATPPDEQVVTQLTQSLSECVERDETGKPQLRISLDNDDALRGLAETLARLLVR